MRIWKTIGSVAVGATMVMVLTSGFAIATPPGIQDTKDRPDAKVASQSELILGLDGTLYRPYKASVIQWVQKELEQRGIYEGEIDGVLDKSMMEAIAEFQKERGLHPSGIPSPLTRKALRGEEGQDASAETTEAS